MNRSMRMQGRNQDRTTGVGVNRIGPLLLLLACGPGNAAENTVQGESFGAKIEAAHAAGAIVFGSTPRVSVPPGGGSDLEQWLEIAIPGALSSDTISVASSAAISSEIATSQGSSTIENVDILGGLVTAELVVAVCDSTANGSEAGSSGEGSTLLGLVIGGVPYGDVTPQPNTQVPIPGVGLVVLNEQSAGGDGVQSSSLTVNMIHVMVDGLPASSDVIVASTRCATDFIPAPVPYRGFLTGGGRLGDGREIATFGLHAGWKAGALRGRVQYIDHGAGLNVHGTDVDSFEQVTETCVSFSGNARVNGKDGYRYAVALACDEAEKGAGFDGLSIAVDGPDLGYQRTGTLSGGNLQLH